MTFRNPWFLTFLLLLIPFVFYTKRKVNAPGFRFSSEKFLHGLRSSAKLKLAQNLILLRAAAIFFVIIALARPQLPIEESKIQTEGIDIVLAVDCSTSMLAEDFKLKGKRQNRLEVVKDVVKNFIQGRQNDRIALIAFAGRAYAVCPLTLDYSWLLQNLERIKTGMVEDGTAIGSGLASSLNRLKDIPTNVGAKSKIVILLTDGRNNAGKISPITASEAAKALNVKVYTIGAGTKGLAPYPAKDFFGNTVYRQVKIDIDEDTLRKIAAETGAEYFRAMDTKSLRNIYKEIDKLEKTPIEEKGYQEYKELFSKFLILGMCLLLLEIVLGNTILRKIP